MIFPLIPQALAIPSPAAAQARQRWPGTGDQLPPRDAEGAGTGEKPAGSTRGRTHLRTGRGEGPLRNPHSGIRRSRLDSQLPWRDGRSTRPVGGYSPARPTISSRAGAGSTPSIPTTARTWPFLEEGRRHAKTFHAEYRIQHITGDWRWTVARAAPLVASDGAAPEWVGMNTDITERKNAEQRHPPAGRPIRGHTGGLHRRLHASRPARPPARRQ